MQILNGILFHAVGASSASLCYTPQKKLVRWSWQTYWLAQAFFCWFLLPIVVAWLTIPQLREVLAAAPKDAMIRSFVLGLAYGIGGTAFGIAIRYIGFSLTYAIAVGISCVLGTLLPPFVAGTLGSVLQGNGGQPLMAGIVLGAIGIGFCGVAGRYKEKDLQGNAVEEGFSLKKGLPICILAGILSAFYGFSLDQGAPIAAVAESYGAGDLKGNVIYIFSNTGAFVTTAIYCIVLHFKNKTWGEYRITGRVGLNYGLSLLTGLLWYGQFFFYGLGHVRLGKFDFTSWAIHMLLLVMFSTLAGVLLKEWKGAGKRSVRWLAGSLIVLITAVILLTYGNYLGSQ